MGLTSQASSAHIRCREAPCLVEGVPRSYRPEELFDATGRLVRELQRLSALFEATDRAWDAQIIPGDDHLAPDAGDGGAVRAPVPGPAGGHCYEAFIHIVDSMVNQHAKWLKTTNHIPWWAPIASLNYLLTCHVWRQDHNDLSHQDPGFIDHVVNKKAEVVRAYMPPDTNTLLSVADHCLRSRHYVNVIVAGKQPALTYLSMDEAIANCTRGLGIWSWAGTSDHEPDVVLACAGDTPTLETLADADLLRTHLPELGARDQRRRPHRTGCPTESSTPCSPEQAGESCLPRLSVAHPSPDLRRTNHRNIHVRGYRDEGTTTTPLAMVMMNDLFGCDPPSLPIFWRSVVLPWPVGPRPRPSVCGNIGDAVVTARTFIVHQRLSARVIRVFSTTGRARLVLPDRPTSTMQRLGP